MNKTECFNYIRANHPDEFYTVPVPHGDPRRTVVRGNDKCRVTVPPSWTVTMAPITAGSHDDWFLCVNEALEPTCTITGRKACVDWVIKNTPWEIITVTLPLGDPRRIINIKGNYNGCIPPASWTVTANPENNIRCYEKEGARFTNTDKFVKYVREQNPKEYTAMMASRKKF